MLVYEQFIIKMKSRHARNNSQVQEKAKLQQYTHHRSFSYTRHRRHSTLFQMHHLTPQNVNTQSITLPVSAELHSRNRPRRIQKTNSKGLKKQKKKSGPKDDLATFQLKRGTMGQPPMKKSREKWQKPGKVFSKQLIRYKYSYQKDHSSDQRNGKSNELKRRNTDKNSKSKQKQKKVKPKQQENPNIQWQNILHQYGNYLTATEVTEIKQYKWIYFLGKIKDRKINGFRPSPNIEEASISQTEEDEFYKYEIGDHIAYRYEIIESINQGSFGEVIKVFDHKTQEHLALKIAKRSQQLVQQTFMQISILTQIRQKDKANLSGVVRIKDFTIFRNHICMLFELLDGNLYQLLVANNYHGLREEIVRIFSVQILNSLSFLLKQGVIHCDIKPENIVMKNWGKSGVKLIDFGTSCFQGKQVYQYLQSRYYRAPEVIFKKKYSHPIDMWSFGCLIAELILGEPIFAGSTNIEQLLYITNSIGFPSQKDGPYSCHFLSSVQFEILSREDYISQYHDLLKNGKDPKDHEFFSECKYAKTCMKTLKERIIQTQQNDDLSLYNFLRKILVWEPQKRLTPGQALQDPWITKGLPTQVKQLYTIFNSVQYSKKTKKSSKDSKTSSNKSNARKSKQKNKMKEHSGDKKPQNGSRDHRLKGPKLNGYSGKPYGNNLF